MIDPSLLGLGARSVVPWSGRCPLCSLVLTGARSMQHIATISESATQDTFVRRTAMKRTMAMCSVVVVILAGLLTFFIVLLALSHMEDAGTSNRYVPTTTVVPLLSGSETWPTAAATYHQRVLVLGLVTDRSKCFLCPLNSSLAVFEVHSESPLLWNRPWSPEAEFTPPPPEVFYFDGILCYAWKRHPELDDARGDVFTYVCNEWVASQVTSPGGLVRQNRLYWPRFVRVHKGTLGRPTFTADTDLQNKFESALPASNSHTLLDGLEVTARRPFVFQTACTCGFSATLTWGTTLTTLEHTG